ncbi:hypothetical protein LTR56_027657 [Elasticomyces elasticus]|nr:hypothetical protein LTR56_027657 [Elasticomyces elasticus]
MADPNIITLKLSDEASTTNTSAQSRFGSLNPAELAAQDPENEIEAKNTEEASEHTTNVHNVMRATEQISISEIGQERAATEIIVIYLLDRVAVFRDLEGLRARGWNNLDADKAFEQQRQRADAANGSAATRLYQMMERNGRQLDVATSGFHIPRVGTAEEPLNIVDFCMAPGGFLKTALNVNAGARAVAFTLPVEDGGHKILLPLSDNIQVKCLDITMPATDMGVTNILKEHEDASKFLPRMFPADSRPFDPLLSATGKSSLALGLEHLKQGGTMIVLLHKVEAWRTVRLLHQFSKFSTVQLFKPTKAHATRSSFYMVATSIYPLRAEAVKAVEDWKETWRLATFGTEHEYREATSKDDATVHAILEDFGDNLVDWGKKIWKTQSDALAQKSWTK